MTDQTHDPALRSWVESANEAGTDFPVQNLPYGMFRDSKEGRPRLGVAIGTQVLDATAAFGLESMKAVMEKPKAERVELRRRISRFLVTREAGVESLLTPMAAAEMLPPCEIGDYSDFYASIHHATNVGTMFRPDNPLMPN